MYLTLKYLHMSLVLISAAWFAIRGGWFLVNGSRPGSSRWHRMGPDLVDGLLLVTGVTLLAFGSWVLLQVSWMQLKLVLLIVYIAFGIATFRLAHAPAASAISYVAALLTIMWMVLIAIYKSPAGPFAA
jgi:uncharacterized membrane protein SirB2